MRRSGTLLGAALAALALWLPAPPAAGGEAATKAGPPTPTELYRDVRWVFEGYAPSWLALRVQAREASAEAHVVSDALPALEFDGLRRVMLADGEPVVADDVRALVGERVRLRGWALPIDELAEARRFVLHDAPFIRCVHVATPATNRQVLVELADGVAFDFTDAPLVVEGVLRVGRFETFAEGDLALYALEDARFQVLPLTKDDMVIGFEHGIESHEGEIHLPARPGGSGTIDPGAHGHGGHGH